VVCLACALAAVLTSSARAFASRGNCGPVLCIRAERGWFSSVGPGVANARPAAWVLVGNFWFPADAAGHEGYPSIPRGKVLIGFSDFPVVGTYARWRRVTRPSPSIKASDDKATGHMARALRGESRLRRRQVRLAAKRPHVAPCEHEARNGPPQAAVTTRFGSRGRHASRGQLRECPQNGLLGSTRRRRTKLGLAHEGSDDHKGRTHRRSRACPRGDRRRDNPSDEAGGAARLLSDGHAGTGPSRNPYDRADRRGRAPRGAAGLSRLHDAGWRPGLAPLLGRRTLHAERRLLPGGARHRPLPVRSPTSLRTGRRSQLLGHLSPVPRGSRRFLELRPHVRDADSSRLGRLAVAP
jgi:hypothetical protein